ncbi:hypothetical protein Q73_04010 [Bacillus coahuilensis m2-6]|uniref:Uncharacterized protein n=1 Tax=Bacillus coahuilensis p1.1.43 TaxID=1150625 RepID=A0A147K9Y2_9BACI|nr:hypothetical protein [Bacillus coahuilensis]KUP07515.1 hypothetical protein Q75_04595 [Bacillus coahuilensis p1.1.43]KUP09075.1 hypothetical protein Q73_04010 [Bacillus coahuilensis m2-6]
MFVRGFILLVGFSLAVSGGVTFIMYLNLLTTGFTFSEYLQFLFSHFESYLLIMGVILITLAIYYPSKKDEMD